MVHVIRLVSFQLWVEGSIFLPKETQEAHTDTLGTNTGLEETQAGIKIARRNINNLRYADDTNLGQKAKKNLRAY